MPGTKRLAPLPLLILALSGPARAQLPHAVARGTAVARASAALLYTTFQDHAVLQRGEPIPVWGRSVPGSDVTVRLAGETATARAAPDGRWTARLAALPAGGPYSLKVSSSAGTRRTVTDVMMGDVYLCSGQSNMEYPTRLASDYDADVNSAHDSLVRLFHVQRYRSVIPRDSFGAAASWQVVSPQAVREFSAVCYFFGRDLRPAVGVPIGLIESAWGGSLIQAWIGPRQIRRFGGYGRSLDLLSTYHSSPGRAWSDWDRIAAAWWRVHDPASAARIPWYSPSYNDASWAAVVPIGTWREWNVPQLETFNGLVWLRKDFTLPAGEAARPAVLSLGAIDQSDITWVDGVQVGASEGYDVRRVYDIPSGVLHAGRNVLAVGIFGGAGLLSPADQITLRFADGRTLRLAGRWRFRISAPMSRTGQIPHVPWLNQFGLTVLHNGMIRPLGATRVRGILWYQGESNTDQPRVYARLLPALIRDWRAQFGADTPFLIVQLPGFMPYHTRPQPSDWARMREVQRRVVADTPHTGLAATIDIGSRRTIHPTDKQDVGLRLALLARSLIYHQDAVGRSPDPLAARRTGRTVRVSFATHGGGLETEESNRAVGFQLCDRVGQCAFVDARQRGAEVDLDASAVPSATTVRYCWDDSPICNLYDREGLPAVPFELPIRGTAH